MVMVIETSMIEGLVSIRFSIRKFIKSAATRTFCLPVPLAWKVGRNNLPNGGDASGGRQVRLYDLAVNNLRFVSRDHWTGA
jgi:hypothetical protein